MRTRPRENHPTTDSVEKKFAALCQIVRAQHFAWRRAVAERFPEADPAEVVALMWRITGETTARAYTSRIDTTLPIARQVAESIVWSSRCMGEDAAVEDREDREDRENREDGGADGGSSTDEIFVRHRACPWKEWHERAGLLAEDRPACDAWFAATLEGINQALGTRLQFETLESLPEGGSSCLRRLWEEIGPPEIPDSHET